MDESILLCRSEVANWQQLEHAIRALDVNVIKTDSIDSAPDIIANHNVFLMLTDNNKAAHPMIQSPVYDKLNYQLPIILLSKKKHKKSSTKTLYRNIFDEVQIPADEQLLLNKIRMLLEMYRAEKELMKIRMTLEQTSQQQQELEQTLLHNQKLQSIGTLAGGIAHDFNNILYSIIGFAEIAKRKLDKDDVLHGYLDKILMAGERGRKLIADILSFSRSKPINFETIAIQDILKDTMSLLAATIPATVEIKLQDYTQRATIHADSTQLQQVFINIINNAVDAMESNEGSIVISIEEVIPNKTILKRLNQLTEKPYYIIKIADNGCGIKPETLQRIFDPFFTTKAVGKGTGLGLASSWKIVADLGGVIDVESQLGKGTTFIIYLPKH
ncbi:MAG: hypothetical protein Tsb005_18420 [Gammaproteobacteria bacterium]